MAHYTEKQLKQIIEKDYGFKQDLIQKPVLCGLWHIQFEVAGIKYYGSTSFAGALPTLSVTGYSARYYDHDTPVKEKYYKEHIKGKRIVLIHCVDPDAGEWEMLSHEFPDQQTAKEYIAGLDDPTMYDYEFISDQRV